MRHGRGMLESVCFERGRIILRSTEYVRSINGRRGKMPSTSSFNLAGTLLSSPVALSPFSLHAKALQSTYLPYVGLSHSRRSFLRGPIIHSITLALSALLLFFAYLTCISAFSFPFSSLLLQRAHLLAVLSHPPPPSLAAPGHICRFSDSYFIDRRLGNTEYSPSLQRSAYLAFLLLPGQTNGNTAAPVLSDDTSAHHHFCPGYE